MDKQNVCWLAISSDVLDTADMGGYRQDIMSLDARM